jgi:hypothetical protein
MKLRDIDIDRLMSLYKLFISLFEINNLKDIYLCL